MIVLGIETSADTGGVALMRGGRLLGEKSFREGLVHGRELVPAISSLLEGARLSPRDLQLIAVDVGPGSYTGVRVGISTAKMLAWALGARLAAVVSLDAMAQAARALGQTLVAVLDARRAHFYRAVYRRERGTLARVSGPALVRREDVLASFPRPAILMGDALSRFPDVFGPGAELSHAPAQFWTPKAAVVAQLGLRMARRADPADCANIEPLYLRLSEAEEKMGIRVDPGKASPESRTDADAPR